MPRCAAAMMAVLSVAMLWHSSAARTVSRSAENTAMSLLATVYHDRRLQQEDEQPSEGVSFLAATADEFAAGTGEAEDGDADAAGTEAAAAGDAEAADEDPADDSDAATASDGAAGSATAFPSVDEGDGSGGGEEGAVAGTARVQTPDDEPEANLDADRETLPDVTAQQPVDAELAERQKAIGGSAGGDEAKLPETDFIRDDEQWLADAAAMTNDFLKTPAVDHLVQGRLEDLDKTELGFDAAAMLRKAVHSTLARCSHTTRLALEDNGGLAKLARLAPCSHRHLTLLFLLEPDGEMPDPSGPMAIASSLSSVNARLFAFAKQLKGRGHQILIAGPDELDQVDFSTVSAIIVVKTLGKAFEAIRGKGVPIIWDHVDYWGEMPFYQLDLWELKTAFAGVFTASRVSQAAFRSAAVPSHILYHNHANYAGFHRPDRTPAPKVLSLQGDFRTGDLDVISALQGYSDRNGLEFRYGKYTGHGRSVSEMSAVVAPEAQDFGDQLRYVMGMGSVDLAVLWPKNYGQFDVCYKPTSRLSQFASLGIPAVAYPFASYIDIFVEFGYPFVATTLPELEEMLDLLRGSAVLRQAASRIMLDMAKYLSVEELTIEHERGLCSFLEAAGAGKAR